MARATKLTLSFHKIRLVFIFRRFKTQKANRSKKTRQLVVPLYGLPFKELAITKSRIKPRKKHSPLLKLLTQPYFLLLLLGIVGAGYFGLNLKDAPVIKLASKTHASELTSTPTKEAKHLDRSLPVRISIPAINLDTALDQVGLKPDGSLEVPADPYMAGWYINSPTPGEIGPAVIDGHVDQVGDIAIFWRLRELKPGDTIEISRQDGSTAKFKAGFLEQFSQDNFPTQKVYGNINYAGLRLITCGGIFNPATGHYSDNIVVFASLSN